MIFLDQENCYYENLKKFFKIQCCRSPGHEERCEDKWKKLRDWLFQSLSFDADNFDEPPNDPIVQQIRSAMPEENKFVNSFDQNARDVPELMDIEEENYGTPNYAQIMPAIPEVSEFVPTFDQNTEIVDDTSRDLIDIQDEKWEDVDNWLE